MRKNIRQRILDILVEPATVTSIKESLKDVESFGTIAYHLKKLEEKGIVKKNKDKTKRGNPTKYFLVKKDMIEAVKGMREEEIKNKKFILSIIKQHPSIEMRELMGIIERSGFPDSALDSMLDCSNDNLVTTHYKITQKGLNFL